MNIINTKLNLYLVCVFWVYSEFWFNTFLHYLEKLNQCFLHINLHKILKCISIFLPAIKICSSSSGYSFLMRWSKMILFARLIKFHCLINFNPALSCHSQRLNCLWSSAKATYFSDPEKALHNIFKFSLTGWGTSWISCLGKGFGIFWISIVSSLKKRGKKLYKIKIY